MSKPNSINTVSTAKGSEPRFEALFSGAAFALHRHDTYTLALTTRGVQCFNYRGSLRYSLPGDVVILHPDELHDGLAGTKEAFGYRAIDINTADIQNILQGCSLPFLDNGVTNKPHFIDIAHRLLNEFGRPLEALEYQDLIYDFAIAMHAEANNSVKHTTANYDAMRLAREYIDDGLETEITLDTLATVTGYSKWQITRDFRAMFGTTPYRYLLLRRLHKAKLLIAQGAQIVDVAHNCHFSDQSHFNRQFKKSFGMTPKVWYKLYSN